MLSAVLLSVVMLDVFMLDVVMLSVIVSYGQSYERPTLVINGCNKNKLP